MAVSSCALSVHTARPRPRDRGPPPPGSQAAGPACRPRPRLSGAPCPRPVTSCLGLDLPARRPGQSGLEEAGSGSARPAQASAFSLTPVGFHAGSWPSPRKRAGKETTGMRVCRELVTPLTEVSPARGGLGRGPGSRQQRPTVPVPQRGPAGALLPPPPPASPISRLGGPGGATGRDTTYTPGHGHRVTTGPLPTGWDNKALCYL